MTVEEISVITFANPNSGRVLTKNSRSSSGGQLPIGGTTGQVLEKNSNMDGDASWQTMTTADITESPNLNFVSDTELNVLENITLYGIDGGNSLAD
jgi:hypothetical protein